MTWIERIDRAEKTGSFTAKDGMLSFSWVDCACGEQDSDIPRTDSGYPLDDELAGLGNDFHSDVIMNDFKSARDHLQRIQNRSSEILAAMETK